MKCHICPQTATKRLRPFGLLFCDECYTLVAEELNKRNIRVADIPRLSEAEGMALDISTAASATECDVLFIWIARSWQEYLRGVELGMIGGWSSWEAYEAHVDEFLNSLPSDTNGKVVLIDSTPDEIATRLEDEQLENTSENRQKVFTMMGCEQIRHLYATEETVEFQLDLTPEQEELLNELFEEAGEDTITFAPSDTPNEFVRVGRNDLCPCGSGRKFKKCCKL